ncbi:hypothetical protein GQ55_1G151600 [Panicum hallii var. hallii]|uniref:DUF7722 domain-containing protein n=2 Tax=Panicum hallii TaxID=206008 RepID=A0A2T7F5I7_9POAL|nr:uncharacterized protein LOC112875495 [Panicum hallii]PAN05580.1 hypothetical protein PAHAL_1G160400 [Panicum hallii]PUZ75325.1 hypothetical protein GQ55_1G151600 [Panicum hallii var. hallii]
MGSLGPTVTMSMGMAKPNGTAGARDQHQQQAERKECGAFGGGSDGFRMPLHYPRYKKVDYEAMPEWRVDCLLREYGLPADGDLDSKRRFAMGAFHWPDQY